MPNTKNPEPEGPHATLTCLSGKYAGKTFHVVQNATIGRSGDNSILLDAMIVSNRHASIYYDEEKRSFFIEDLGSRTGVLIDDEFVDDRAPLVDGQSFTIANEFRFEFHVGASPREAVVGSDGAEELAGSVDAKNNPNFPIDEAGTVPDNDSPQLQADVQDGNAKVDTEVGGGGGMGPAAKLMSPAYELIEPDPKGRSGIMLAEGINLIGRDEANTIVLQDSSVSRHHAVIVVDNGRIAVRDLDSKNHTFVDGRRVDDETEMEEGSVVLFGMVSFVVRRRH